MVSVFQMCNFEFYKSGLYKSVYRYEFEFDTSDFELYMFVSKLYSFGCELYKCVLHRPDFHLTWLI